MGDEQRSVEAEVEEEEMRTVRHCPPINPLPEEIKKMQRSETVCRYCGVSYLIYHEFHQLNTRLAQLETELQDLRECAEREKAQREALELGRLEWERAVHLEVQRKAEEREKSIKEALEEKSRDAEKLLRAGFERRRREMEEDHHKFTREKEEKVRRELGALEEERLRRQREELERRREEREEVLSAALQNARENLEEQRKYMQQLEKSLAAATSAKEEAERSLGGEKHQGGILRGVCEQQVRALRATLSALRSSAKELSDIRGLLSQLTTAWQAFRSQILQRTEEAFSVLTQELKHTSEELHSAREENKKLNQQLMEQRRQREEQLSKQEESERKHRDKILRLNSELEQNHDKWLSCQQRCEDLRQQLSSWQEREEETSRQRWSAEEEATQLKDELEKVQQGIGELRKERDTLINSHGIKLKRMEEDYRQQMASQLATALEAEKTQSALQLQEQMQEFRRETELELSIDREKNGLLLQQYQRDSAQLQHKLKRREQEVADLKAELHEARRSREEERRTQEEQRWRREEEIEKELEVSRQQGALQLSEARAELQLLMEGNSELEEEVAFLQETVRRECQEREDLIAALSKAQEELFALRSPASHQDSSMCPPNPAERHTPPGNMSFHSPSAQDRVPLTRSSTSPNALRPSSTDCAADGGGAGRGFKSQNGIGLLGGEKQQEATLPRLRLSSVEREVKWKVTAGSGRNLRNKKWF